MIPENELRIGSYVNYKGELIPISKGFEIDRHSNKFEPIALTPEILERCGFNEGSVMPDGDTEYYIKGKLYGWLSGNEFSVDYNHDYEYYSAKAFNLHQLQNLYFALTGEELNIKL